MRDLEARMGNALEPFREDLENLTTIPGISDVAAHVITGEIGLDMSRFTVGNAISWASLCPRLDESAGKHRSRRIRKGAPWLKTTLVSAAWAAVKTKGSYLQAQFQRRRGAKKAIIAVAASMLTAAYYILRDKVPYKDLGPDHFTRRDKKHVVRRLQRRIEDLGFAVEIRSTIAGVSI
jgi:transposase